MARLAREPAPAVPPEVPSMLEDLIELCLGMGPFLINFEDLTGFTYDAPEFHLSDEKRGHLSPFCIYAKIHQTRPRSECTLNKRLCNRKAMRGRGYEGMCYLGMHEAVEPLQVGGKTLGVFYLGATRIAGMDEVSQARILRHCERHGISPDPYLTRFQALPQVTQAVWEKGCELLHRAARLATELVENIGLPLESYNPHTIRRDAARHHHLNPLTREAMSYIRRHYRHSLLMENAARELGCHPVHLGRTFRRDLGMSFNDFVQLVRVSHAKRLLRVHAMNASRVTYEVGFNDASHFNRVFRKLVGQTPGEYASRAEA